MNADKLLDDVCGDDPELVAAALQAAHGRADELVPKLLERLDAVLAATRNPEVKSVPYVGLLFYLAAEFKARAAHGQMVRLLRMPVNLIDGAIGDVLTEGAGIALADTYPGAPEAIYGLVEDAGADPYARGAGLTALATLWKRGAFPREELLGRMLRLTTLLDPKSGNDMSVGNALVDTAVRVNAHEIRESILGLYERDLADEMYFESEYTRTFLAPGAPTAYEAARLDDTIDDAWTAVKDWAFFDEDAPNQTTVPGFKPEFRTQPLPLSPPPGEWVPPTPFLAPPKIGRNEPCPCGSGKKYKKCCGG